MRILLFVLMLSPASGWGQPPAILVLGDSLSAAYGLAQDDGWVSLLQRRLHREGHDHRVINASISGDTTRGGLERIGAALARNRPAIVIVELGGNDGLRGIAVAEMRENLRGILAAVIDSGAQALLVGIRIPPNYGEAYADAFYETYRALARRFEIEWVPFLLAGVADEAALMQEDGIHPVAAAQTRILDNVWPHLVPLLER